MPKQIKPEVSPLSAHLGFWMRMVSNHVSQAFSHKSETAGATVAEWVILRTLLGEGRLSPSAVAVTVGLSRGQVSKLVDALVGRGLVLRLESKTDRRYQELRLSSTGETLTARLAGLADTNDEEHFHSLNSAERRRLRGLLKKVAAARGLTRIPID